MAKKCLSVLLSVLLVLTALPMALLPVLAEDAPDQTPAIAEDTAIPEAVPEEEEPIEPEDPEITDPLGLFDYEFTAPLPQMSPQGTREVGDITWSFDENTKTLTFTGQGAMTDYVMDFNNGPMLPETPWKDLYDTVETIVIGENITHVGSASFVAFEALKEVVLPSTLTSIGEYAFAYCVELTTIDLPAGLTEIGRGALSLNKISSITIPAGVTEIRELFIMNLAPLSITLNEGLETIDQCFDSSVIAEFTIPSTVTSFTGYVSSDGTEQPSRILNTQTFVNRSAAVAVSDWLAHVNPDTVDYYFLMASFEYRYNLMYLRTGEEPDEEDMYPLYLEYYNTILGTDYTDFEVLVADVESGNLSEEAMARMEEFEAAMDVYTVPLPTVGIYCLSESAEHDMLHANGFPHYLIDNDNQLCEEPVPHTCGDHLTWEIADGTLTITGYGAMYDNYAVWQFYGESVNDIVFAEQGGAITKIGQYAFRSFGTLDTVTLPAGVSTFGYGWLDSCTVGTLIFPAGFTCWDDSNSSMLFQSYARAVNGYSVAAGNPVYFVENGTLYGTHDDRLYLLRSTGSSAIKDGTNVIGYYAFYNNKTITEITFPESVTEVYGYAFEYCTSLTTVHIPPADHALYITLAGFNYCPALAAFTVDAADTRFAVQDGVLYTKDMTKVVAVPFAIHELTLPDTVTGVYSTGGNSAYCNNGGGLTKLTVPNREFYFGYSNNSSNPAFYMAYRSDRSEIEICGYTASTAESFAARNGYTFTPLDDVTIESIEYDLSRVPASVTTYDSVSFESWGISGVITYSNGTTRNIYYGSDFSIYYQYPNSTSWQENNWMEFSRGTGVYTLEIRYGTNVKQFTITAVEPDYHFEFDTSGAITEVRQYADRSAYEGYNQNNYHVLGVKLYKVFDDPERPRELMDISSCCSIDFIENGSSYNWYEMLTKEAGSVYTVRFRYNRSSINVQTQINVTILPCAFTVEVDDSNVLTQVDQTPGNYITPQALGIVIYWTENGVTTDVTGSAWFNGDTDLSTTGSHTVELWLSRGNLYRSYGEYSFTVLPVTYEIELASYEVLQYTGFSYNTWSPSVYKVKDGVRTQIFPDNGIVYFRYQNASGSTSSYPLDTAVLGTYTVMPYTYINNNYLELSSVEITVVPNTFTYELDTTDFISSVEQYFPYSTYNSGLKVNKVTDGVSEPYNETVYCSGYVDQSTPGDYTLTPYFNCYDNGVNFTVYFDPVTVTVTPCTLELEILSYTETVEQYGSYASASWAPAYSVTRGGEPFTDGFSVYFYYLQPGGSRVSYLNTTEPGEYTIYAYIYYNGYEIDTQPLTVTVTESPATFTLDLTNVPTEIVQYGSFSIWNTPVTMEQNGATTTLNNYVYMNVTDPEGNSRYNSLNAALPGVHTVYPYINYNSNRIDLEPFTVTVTASGITFGIDTTNANLNVLQYSVYIISLKDLGAVATKTVNGVTTALDNYIYATVFADTAGEYTVSPYIYYDESGSENYSVSLPEVTVTVLSAAENAEALTLGETSTTEGLPYNHRAVYRFTPAVSGTYTFSTTGSFSYGYSYLYDENNNDCGYKYVYGSNNVMTATLTAGVTYVYYMECSGSAPYTVSVELGHVHQFTVLEAADPTCAEPGNVDCVYCTICEKYFTDATASEELTEAEALIPAINHANAEHHGANNATCAAPGNIEYWYCPDCETYFSDAACTASIPEADTVIPAINHENAEHHGANNATCAAEGNIEYWYCPDCEIYFSDAACTAEIAEDDIAIPAINHRNAEHHAAKGATCAAEGNIEYWYCPDCETYFSDSACTSAITEAQTVIGINAAAHNYGAWTKLNDQKHQRVCANDPNHVETADHSWNGGTVTASPTCSAKGVKTFTCTDCGATKTQELATVGHKDDNSDGWCDYNCGTPMINGQPGQPTQPGEPSGGGDECPLCHEHHTGFFGKIVGFFHRIIYFFKNLFSR